MTKIMILKSFELNNIDLLNEWLEISNMLNSKLKGVDGFGSREAFKGSDNKIYCCAKWDSKKQQENFREQLEALKEWPEISANLARLVDMKTMTMQVLEVL